MMMIQRLIHGLLLGTMALLIWAGRVSGQEAGSGGDFQLPDGVEYSVEARQEPRKLRIHRLVIDLEKVGNRLAVGLDQDPDQQGPAETQLTKPIALAQKHQMRCAINTNAWAMLPDAKTGKPPGYIVGGHANISGWAMQGEDQRSPREPAYWSCWQESDGRCWIGCFAPESPYRRQPQEPRWAVSGFRGILMDGKILAEPSDVLHPRTALGLSDDGKRMVWLVVDGRQPGYSEGVSERELAELLVEAGCQDGMNLDGGGSSVMLLTSASGILQPVNKPSDKLGARPIPVLLGIGP
ncbi:MAG: phosphodiester glycosidase family protein [Pirellulaceae bacterium]